MPASGLDRAFSNILREVCPDWTTHQINLCVEDLVDLLYEQNDAGSIRDCYDVWLRRIGGKQNLDSYVATLEAGKR